MAEGNLWGDLSNFRKIRTPKTILAEQAAILNEATMGVVRAQVSSSGDNSGNITHTLSLIAPVLGNYQFTVLYVAHDVSVYPCRILSPPNAGWVSCEDEEHFARQLVSVLGNEKTRRVIESLLSQSNE
jgi:hypothetical protein